MSTDYYLPATPITSIRVLEEGAHARVTFWVNHANVGTLTLRDEEVGEFLSLVRGRQVAHSHSSKEGLVISFSIDIRALYGKTILYSDKVVNFEDLLEKFVEIKQGI